MKTGNARDLCRGTHIKGQFWGDYRDSRLDVDLGLALSSVS